MVISETCQRVRREGSVDLVGFGALNRGGGGLGLLRGVVRRSPSASLVEVEIRKGLGVDRVESGLGRSSGGGESR